MRRRDRLLHRKVSRSRFIAVGLSIAAALSLSIAASGAGATSTVRVVPVSGTVAGHGYSYWLARDIQTGYDSASNQACKTLTAKRQSVGLLIEPSKTGKFTCSEPAGRPVYVDEAEVYCSTFAGEHGTYGTTDRALTQCARSGFESGIGSSMSVTVDGKSVNMAKLRVATSVFPVRAVKGNSDGAHPGSGRVAAYGSGLLLTGLGKGTHVIHSAYDLGGNYDYTFTVLVH